MEKDRVSPYQEFAGVYDRYMDHVPYEAWARHLLSVSMDHFGRIPSRVLDMACGTGKLLYHLKEHVKNLAGMDASAAMLKKASLRLGRDAVLKQGLLQGPMPFRKNSMEWILCSHDSLNYLTQKEDLHRHFASTAEILKEGGLYSCDVVSLHNILAYFDGKTEMHTIRGKKFRWSNEYNKQTKIMLSLLEFQTPKGTKKEYHYQRYYSLPEVIRTAESAGLKFLFSAADYSDKPPGRKDVLINLHFTR